MQKTLIGIAIGIVICGILAVSLGYWAVQKGAQNFFYPKAPPMPPVVDTPMPEILSHLESVLKTNAPQVLATLRPGISAGEIGRLELRYGVRISDDIKAVYEWHDGSVPMAATNYIEFVPIHRFVPLEDMLAEKAEEMKGQATGMPAQRAVTRVFGGYQDHWYCLFDDGTGNGYFFDPTRKPEEGALFCVFLEDGDYTFFPSAKNLMVGIAKCFEQGAYRVKPGNPRLELDWDIEQSAKIWKEFGAGNQSDSE